MRPKWPPSVREALIRTGEHRAVASLLRKALGVIGLYAPPPLNRLVAQWRGVRFIDPKTTWIGVRTLIDNEYPELVTIGANVTISFDVDIMAHFEPPAPMQARFLPAYQAPVEIGSNVFVGARAIILPGVIVHEWAVVAAGAVVTRDVLPYSIVAGNPARAIGDVRDRTHRFETSPGDAQ